MVSAKMTGDSRMDDFAEIIGGRRGRKKAIRETTPPLPDPDDLDLFDEDILMSGDVAELDEYEAESSNSDNDNHLGSSSNSTTSSSILPYRNSSSSSSTSLSSINHRSDKTSNSRMMSAHNDLTGGG